MKLDVNEPLYIIELGAGSGKFSYYMLKALEEMQAICDFPIGIFISISISILSINDIFLLI
jgi:SAM-dependent MidA family methyltransferase